MNRRIASVVTVAVPSDRDRETLARRFDIQGFRMTRAGGVPVIEGEVPCYRMKKRAGAAVARLLGVVHVVNRLRVVPQGHRGDAELAEAVRLGLHETGLGDQGIAVTARDGIVILRGTVSSPAVRCEAEATAWAIGGVADVENRLRAKCQAASGGLARNGDASPSLAYR